MGDTLLATSKLESWKAHTMRENIGVIGNYGMLIPGLDWALCRLYASFLQFGKKLLLYIIMQGVVVIQNLDT
jgi:hypothetical protein